jgi:2-amino-4-hydroxy-6-hydroxymethyldihydropteridine diphosphokinase
VLTLPHPRAAERAFVLVPWVEIDPRPELAAQLARLPVADRESVRIRLDLALQWPGSLPG